MHAPAIPAAAGAIACAPATGAISRYRHPTVRAGRRRCSSFCPASETKVVYGSNIDSAATENGKPYSELPNAFRYRNGTGRGMHLQWQGPESVSRPLRIESDPTLREGDVVSRCRGLMVTGRGADKRGASLNFSPASHQIARGISACRWWLRSDLSRRAGEPLSPLTMFSGDFRMLIGALITFLVVILILYLIQPVADPMAAAKQNRARRRDHPRRDFIAGICRGVLSLAAAPDKKPRRMPESFHGLIQARLARAS